VPTATIAKDMARTFSTLRVGLIVDISGGIPNLSKGIDVRFVDIVVSKSEKTWEGWCNMTRAKPKTEGNLWSKGSSISRLLSYCTLLLNFGHAVYIEHSIAVKYFRRLG